MITATPRKLACPLQVGISTPHIVRSRVAPLPAQSDNVESKCQRNRGRCVGMGAVFYQDYSKSYCCPPLLNNLLFNYYSSCHWILNTLALVSLVYHELRYGLVVRIPGSHPGGPGSIPGNGKSFCKVHDAKKRNNNISANTQNAKSEQSDARNCNDKMEVFLYEDTQKTPFRSRILTSYH